MYRRLTVGAVTALALAVAGPALLSDTLDAQQKRAIGYEEGQPFSPAVEFGNTIYFSGSLGLNEEVLSMVEGPARVQEETRLIMEGFRERFEEMGIGFEDVVKATVYITNLDYYDALNEVYVEYFPQDAPARAAVEVSDLVADAMVEISFIAVRQ